MNRGIEKPKGATADDFFYRVSAKALVIDEQNRILLAREENGFWELLGGSMDYGQSAKKTIIREVKEETGIDVLEVAEQPSYFVSGKHTTQDYWIVNVLFETRLADLDFTPSKECVELKFFEASEIQNINAYETVKDFARQLEMWHKK